MPEPGSGTFTLEAWSEGAEGWAFECVLDPASLHFRGHFPGRPVLPAIAQLDLLAQAASRALGRGYLAELGRLRLTLALVPGDRLRVRMDRPDEEGRLSFSILRGPDTASAGTLAWRPV